MIDGVVITPQRVIPDERGMIKHMLKSDSPNFKQFGEIYFSFVYPGAVKAWHLHKIMTLNYAVPVGNIKFVLYDPRENSPTYGQIQEIYMGEANHCLVTVPPGIWNGFKGIGTQTAVVANFTDIPHDPNEIIRCSPTDGTIAYDWNIVMK